MNINTLSSVLRRPDHQQSTIGTKKDLQRELTEASDPLASHGKSLATQLLHWFVDLISGGAIGVAREHRGQKSYEYFKTNALTIKNTVAMLINTPVPVTYSVSHEEPLSDGNFFKLQRDASGKIKVQIEDGQENVLASWDSDQTAEQMLHNINAQILQCQEDFPDVDVSKCKTEFDAYRNKQEIADLERTENSAIALHTETAKSMAHFADGTRKVLGFEKGDVVKMHTEEMLFRTMSAKVRDGANALNQAREGFKKLAELGKKMVALKAKIEVTTERPERLALAAEVETHKKAAIALRMGIHVAKSQIHRDTTISCATFIQGRLDELNDQAAVKDKQAADAESNAAQNQEFATGAYAEAASLNKEAADLRESAARHEQVAKNCTAQAVRFEAGIKEEENLQVKGILQKDAEIRHSKAKEALELSNLDINKADNAQDKAKKKSEKGHSYQTTADKLHNIKRTNIAQAKKLRQEAEAMKEDIVTLMGFATTNGDDPEEFANVASAMHRAADAFHRKASVIRSAITQQAKSNESAQTADRLKKLSHVKIPLFRVIGEVNTEVLDKIADKLGSAAFAATPANGASISKALAIAHGQYGSDLTIEHRRDMHGNSTVSVTNQLTKESCTLNGTPAELAMILKSDAPFRSVASPIKKLDAQICRSNVESIGLKPESRRLRTALEKLVAATPTPDLTIASTFAISVDPDDLSKRVEFEVSYSAHKVGGPYALTLRNKTEGTAQTFEDARPQDLLAVLPRAFG